MLGIVGDGSRLIDQQNRYAPLDAIDTSQPRVIEALIGHVEQRTAILRADEYVQQPLVESHLGPVTTR